MTESEFYQRVSIAIAGNSEFANEHFRCYQSYEEWADCVSKAAKALTTAVGSICTFDES